MRIIVADAAADEVIRLLTATGLAVATERVGRADRRGLAAGRSVPDARLLAESLARLAISHALSPTTEPDETAAAVTRMLGPFVDDLLT